MAKKSQKQEPLSPKKYIMTRARTLPVDKCYVNSNWEITELATLLVTRKHNNGNLTGAGFNIDFQHFGLKDGYAFFNLAEFKVTEMLEDIFDEDSEFMEIPYELAHNMVYGGIEFAEDNGYDGKKNADLGLYVMQPVTDDIEFMDLPFNYENNLFDDIFDEEMADMIHFDLFDADDWKEYFEENSADSIGEDSNLTSSLFYFLAGVEHPNLNNDPYDILDIPITFDTNPSGQIPQNQTEEIVRIQQDLMMSDKDELPKEIEKIKKCIEKYPKTQIFYNLLIQAYQFVDDTINYIAAIEEVNSKFPNYLMGRVSKGNFLIDTENFSEFEKIFPAPYTPMAAFPDRKEFHYTEIVPFLSTIVRYLAKKGDLIRAYQFEQMVYGTLIEYPEIDELPNSNIFQIASDELLVLKTQYCKENWRKVCEM